MLKVKGHRLLVLLDPVAEEVTNIPGFEIQGDKKAERNGTQRGLVIDIGSQAFLAFREMDDQGNEHNGKPWCNIGSYITFARYAGRTIQDPEEITQKDFIVLNDSDVICVHAEGKHSIPSNELRDEVISKGVLI